MFNTFAALATAAALATGTLYPATMEITNISDNVVTMETATGHIFEMSGPEDYEIGDLVSLVMDDNGTPDDITDDSIISARYSGFWCN